MHFIDSHSKYTTRSLRSAGEMPTCMMATWWLSVGSKSKSKSKSKLLYDWRSVSMSWRRAPFPFFCRKLAFLFSLGRPLWREDGSAICSAICQWSEPRRTRNHTLLSPLRLLGSLSVASYESQGLRRKYSYPPPHGSVTELSHSHLAADGQSVSTRSCPPHITWRRTRS
jgi:hypothetical protein